MPLVATDSSAPATLLLTTADRTLSAGDLPGEQVAELQQQRLDAMIELGIDERCHPVIE